MKVVHNQTKESDKNLFLFILGNGEKELQLYNELEANIVQCHIDSDGHNITQEELYSEKNVNHLMLEFVEIIKTYQSKNKGVNFVFVGSEKNAEVTLDLLLKENELIEGAVLIKPILNIGITDGLRIEDNTKVLIIEGSGESDEKHEAEEEVADILAVNGYEVTVVEIDENENLSQSDIQESINWIKQEFYS